MSIKQLRKFLACIVIIAIFFLLLFYFGGYNVDLRDVNAGQLSSDQLATETLTGEMTLSQQIEVTSNEMTSVVLHLAGGSHAHFSYVFEADGRQLTSGEIDQDIGNGKVELLQDTIIVLGIPTLTLHITILDGNNVSFFYGNMIELARGMVTISGLTDETSLMVNGKALNGKLNLEIIQQTMMNVSLQLTILCLIAVVLLSTVSWWVIRCYRKGKILIPVRVAAAIKKYNYVLRQLVNRDFKKKYKRSVLGILWSFLNPLMTMLIQYAVFSTIFQSSIENFAVYLLSGTICFSFFNEATTTGLSSISDNANLITKMYIPKYIFPISRVLSSGINFTFSLIPLFAAVLISGLPVTRAYLFLPFIFLCLLMLSVGTAMLLSAVMVFFRDVQFLWSVTTTLLMYATPLFYPESIIPAKLLFFFKLNPLYHVIRIFRVVIMEGTSPMPRAILLSFAICVFALGLGVFVFKKEQDKFVVNL